MDNITKIYIFLSIISTALSNEIEVLLIKIL